ncbi:MAG: A circularly permuted ATPgrasp family protein [Burkholderiales bacterium]|nr:MAG: A circularly permuted ATPgrasp family protein [Burkholderiales bacterium]
MTRTSTPNASLRDAIDRSFVERLAQDCAFAAKSEMMFSGDELAPHWKSFFEQSLRAHHGLRSGVEAADSPESVESFRARLLELNATVQRRVADNGITYNVYSDASSQARPWSLDLLPMIVPQHEWQSIERGVLQRVHLLNDVLNDVYGAQTLVKRGLLPTAIVKAHPRYLRPAHGIAPPGGTHLHITGFDLARGADGTWWIISQRTDAPSGLGYLLENRMIVSRLFPDAFRELRIERVLEAYKGLMSSLASHSKVSSPHIVLLTPGPFNETYFEHVYLARYLGLTLAEGGDLVVRNERVWLKTIKGLSPVDVILRRLDDDFLDPLELRSDSALGIPGLIQAYRAGNVVLANAPGSAWLESSAVLAFLPRIADALYGEAMSLPSIATWWCGEQSAMQSMLPALESLVIKPTYSDRARRFVPVTGHSLSERERKQWVARIARKPENFVAQAYLPLSRTPTFDTGGSGSVLGSRAAMLRVYAISDGVGQWRVLPGGLARVAPPGKEIVSMYRGGSSADVWAVTGRVREDRAPLSSMLTPIRTHQSGIGITSRAAENLFWLGRYTERLDNSTRLARITLEALASNDEGNANTESWLSALAVENGLVTKEVPTMRQSAAVFERALIASLADRDAGLGAYSVAATLQTLKQTAFAVRERLALEQWTLVTASEQEFHSTFSNRSVSSQAALRALERLAQQVMAITGAQADRMTRDDGWRMLSVGRQIERLVMLSHALAEALEANAISTDSGFALVLALFDSTITYRARYLQRRDARSLVELLALDRDNPRSLAWVSQTLQSRLAKLDNTAMGVLPELLQERSLPHQWSESLIQSQLSRGDAGDLAPIIDRLKSVIDEASGLSDVISQRYFSHAQRTQTLGAGSANEG